MVFRVSPGSLLYLNLALGLFIAVANGAALMMVLTGRAEKLAGQGMEIAVWFAAGLLLAVTAGYALRHSERVAAILRIQTFLVIALVVALAAWAVTIFLGNPSSGARVVWAPGYLSLTALYCAVLGSHAFPEPQNSAYRQALFWLLVPVCVLVDILTYMKVAGGS
jgi:hypothetical protein